MSKKSIKAKDIKEIAQHAQAGADISEHFTGNFQAKQTLDVTVPLELLKQIDSQCQKQNISRQAWIKMACTEKIRHMTTSISKTIPE